MRNTIPAYVCFLGEIYCLRDNMNRRRRLAGVKKSSSSPPALMASAAIISASLRHAFRMLNEIWNIANLSAYKRF